MKYLLQIQKPENSSHIVWEHIIKSALAFTGTFAMLFFGPLLLEAKSSRHSHGHDNSSFTQDFFAYLFEHPEVQFGLCFLAVILYNLFIIFKNAKRKYAVSIAQDEDCIIIGKTNLYYKTVTEVSTPLKDFAYELKTKTTDAGEKQSTLRFVNASNQGEIAIIKPSHVLWSKQMRDLRELLRSLNNLGVARKDQHSNRTSFAGSLFKR